MKTMELWRKVCVTAPHAVKPITDPQGSVMNKKMNDCIIWSKAKTKSGYGVTTVNGKTVYAHRLAAEQAYGPIPKGVMVCHRCDTPSCVNPEHLFLGSHKENMQDMRMKGRSAGGNRHKSVTKPDSVQRGEKVGTSKLTEEQVACIRASYTPGKSGVKSPNSYMSLAKSYGVSYAAIHKIVNGRMWA